MIRFLVTFLSLTLTTLILYMIGSLFHVSFLTFQYEYTHSDGRFFFHAGSLVPLIIGLIVSFFAEKWYVRRSRTT